MSERTALPPAPPLSAYAIAVLPPLFWAGNFIVGRLMNATIPPLQFSFWRWTIAFLILCVLAGPKVRAAAPQLRRELPWLVLLGGVGITAFNCFVYTALHFTTVVNGTLINALAPVLTFILAIALLGERLSPLQVLGIAVSIVGAAIIIVRGDLDTLLHLTFNKGDLLVLAGTAFWSVYTVLLRVRPTKLPPLVFLWAIVGFGVLIHTPLVAAERALVGGFDLTSAGALSILYVAVFPSVASYIIWNRAVAVLGPGRTGMTMHLIPVFAAILAVVFLDEQFAVFHAIGIVLIASGIALVLQKPVAPARPRP